MRPLAVALLCALLGGGAYAKDAEDCIAAAGKSRADGVRITSAGSDRTSFPSRSSSSRSLTLITCFMFETENKTFHPPAPH